MTCPRRASGRTKCREAQRHQPQIEHNIYYQTLRIWVAGFREHAWGLAAGPGFEVAYERFGAWPGFAVARWGLDGRSGCVVLRGGLAGGPGFAVVRGLGWWPWIRGTCPLCWRVERRQWSELGVGLSGVGVPAAGEGHRAVAGQAGVSGGAGPVRVDTVRGDLCVQAALHGGVSARGLFRGSRLALLRAGWLAG